MSTWKELVDGAAEKFNVFPTLLQLQYIFSNERPTSLPFELNSEQAYQQLLAKYKHLIDPGLTSSGKPRKAKPKTIIIKLFNKNAESGEGGSKGKGKVRVKVPYTTEDFIDLCVMLQTTSKFPMATSEVPQTKADKVHERKKHIAAEITEQWTCVTHSLPDKPVLCWRAPVPSGQPTGPCYPITVSNVNVWTSLVVRTFHQSVRCIILNGILQIQDPDQFSAKVKPLQVTVQQNGARHQVRKPDPNQPEVPFLGMPPQPTMPYGFYASPHMYFPGHMQQHGWPGLPPSAGFHPSMMPGFHQPAPIASTTQLIKGPAITNWLDHCDLHKDRPGTLFHTLVGKFEREGYQTIDQLTSSRVTVADLSSWLNIGKGTADLIVTYADADMVLAQNGTFKLESALGSGDSFDWGVPGA